MRLRTSGMRCQELAGLPQVGRPIDPIRDDLLGPRIYGVQIPSAPPLTRLTSGNSSPGSSAPKSGTSQDDLVEMPASWSAVAASLLGSSAPASFRCCHTGDQR